ncbi:hypothetical protein O0I10_005135 [Lichtheimia ornata]|uniref:Phosphatidylglycerol/phosphatidylinositol transfer protein n=1 Tax=Lichtheimia ornata TaxID=688661 RepID=A0AAD7V4X8_9FUNG|nr:uncharacterized protein O0I10_005135 [Lichtheimia ornata]KAJ8659097.1 hypothetical protein O0I10_005135 [Lichtheimia ornata]
MYTHLLSWLIIIASVSSAVKSAWIEKYKPNLYQFQIAPLETSLIHDCSDSSYILDIYDITLSPRYPLPGDNLTIEAIGFLEEPVSYGAKADVLVKLGFVQLLKKEFDICEEMDNNDVELQCPIMDGPVKVTQKVTLPKEIPKAHFKVQVRAKNHNNHPLACLDVDVDFRHHRLRHSSSNKKNRLADAEW